MKQKTVIIVGGVSGCGKSTLTDSIVNCKLNINERCKSGSSSVGYDGDHFHSLEAKEKMARGIGLTDEERGPWLERICSHITRELEDQDKDLIVIACSVLKKRYRDIFRERIRGAQLIFLFLNPPRSVLEDRLAERKGHFAGVSLLDSQFEALELPDSSEKDCHVQPVFDAEIVLAELLTL